MTEDCEVAPPSALFKSLAVGPKQSESSDTLEELPKVKLLPKKPLKRGRSLIGPTPVCKFGPKASTIPHASMQYEIDPYDQKLKWSRPPENVLVIKKIESMVNKSFKALVTWLVIERQLTVFVEDKALQKVSTRNDTTYASVRKKLKTSYKPEQIDLVICLGGDGTLLYAASLFQKSMPPVVAFSYGSLGFLTAHMFDNYRETITNVLDDGAMLMLRSRLRCTVLR